MKHRFFVFDGLRGIAAFCVLSFHYEKYGSTPLGYLAVDLFFLLSGFVVAAAYEDKLKQGRGFSWFFGVRMARLYPFYLLGIAFGVVEALCSSLIGPIEAFQPVPIDSLVQAAVASALFIPFSTGGPMAFPLNSPAWSLAAELAVNLIYAAGAFRLGNRALAAITAITGLALGISIVVVGHASGGWSAENFWMGFLRIAFSFPLGILMWRLCKAGRLPKLVVPLPLIVFAPVVLFQLPGFGGATDLLAIFVIFPSMLIAGAGATRASAVEEWIYGWLGRLSYPLYSLHEPLRDIFAGMTIKYGLAFQWSLAPLILVVGASTIWYERRVRARSSA